MYMYIHMHNSTMLIKWSAVYYYQDKRNTFRTNSSGLYIVHIASEVQVTAREELIVELICEL